MAISRISLTDRPADVVNFDEPVAMLLACHGKILDQCVTLQKMLVHQQQFGCDDQLRQAAASVLRYFDTAAQYHHQDEELDLFPLLVDCMPAQELLAELLVQHEQLAQYWQLLRPALLAMVEGEEVMLDSLAIDHFVSLYQQHVLLENAQLLPHLCDWLEADQLRQLGEAMEKRRISV